MDWKQFENIAPSRRDSVVLALFHAGYAVRPRKRKEGNKTVQYIETRLEDCMGRLIDADALLIEIDDAIQTAREDCNKLIEEFCKAFRSALERQETVSCVAHATGAKRDAERLTYYDKFESPRFKMGGKVYSNTIAARLSAYEDSGLTPEEVTELKTLWDMYGGEEGITAAFKAKEERDQIVHCMNCGHCCGHSPLSADLIYCTKLRIYTMETDFCSYGEKKGG